MSNATITKSNHRTADSAAFSGVFFLAADTASDAAGPMAAPVGCADPTAYRVTVRQRYKTDQAVRQQMVCLSRRLEADQHHAKVPITGPFADDAREVLTLVHQSATQPKRKAR